MNTNEFLNTTVNANRGGTKLPALNNKLPTTMLLPYGVGIEIEMERAGDAEVLDTIATDKSSFWRVKIDGSLRRGGVEFVSGILFDNSIPQALREVSEILKTAGIAPTYGFRCSVHVHMDVRHLTLNQLISFILTYTIVEPLLFNKCGEERANNFYCLPYSQSDDFADTVSGLINSTSCPEFINFCDRFQKYSALNLRPVFGQGSVEFRHHYGTHDSIVLVEWINTLQCILKYAMNTEYSNLPEFVSGVGIDNYLQSIFGAERTASLLFPNYDEYVLNNIRIVQNMIRFGTMQRTVKTRITDLACRFEQRGWSPNLALQKFAERSNKSLTNNAKIEGIIRNHLGNSKNNTKKKVFGDFARAAAAGIQRGREFDIEFEQEREILAEQQGQPETPENW